MAHQITLGAHLKSIRWAHWPIKNISDFEKEFRLSIKSHLLVGQTTMYWCHWKALKLWENGVYFILLSWILFALFKFQIWKCIHVRAWPVDLRIDPSFSQLMGLQARYLLWQSEALVVMPVEYGTSKGYFAVDPSCRHHVRACLLWCRTIALLCKDSSRDVDFIFGQVAAREYLHPRGYVLSQKKDDVPQGSVFKQLKLYLEIKRNSICISCPTFLNAFIFWMCLDTEHAQTLTMFRFRYVLVVEVFNS